MNSNQDTKLPTTLNEDLAPLPKSRRFAMRLALGLGLLPILAACHHDDDDDDDNNNKNNNGGNNSGDLGVISDSRLKENITRIGTTAKGLPFYTFSYIGKSEVYAGVMAQDVLNVMPDAVLLDSSGFYKVDYAKLGLRMLRLQ
jgi:hypothetical protein